VTNKPRRDDQTRAAELPSVPDRSSEPPIHNEPEIPVRPDRVPPTRFDVGAVTSSRAELRLRAEQLLARREGASVDEWAALGDDVPPLLVQMLGDWSIRSEPATWHRVIATLGTLKVKRGVAGLGALLADDSTAPVTKAHAANALGRIGDDTALHALASAADTDDEMVRRQVAMALGRIDSTEAIPHLLSLRADRSLAVSEVAANAIERWQRQLGRELGPKTRVARPKTATRKKPPAADYD
jgi:HEAT repeat protein